MNVLRLAAAGIVAGLALGTASVVAFLAGGYVFMGGAIVFWSRRLRPRRRYVFARR